MKPDLDNILWMDEHIGNALTKNLQTSESTLSHSGNSDVDINIQIDTKPIAFAMLYSLLATKQMTNAEFEKAVKRLEGMTSVNNKINNHVGNDTGKVKLYERN